ncbi:MAG: hypothetical protein EOO63_01260 [Hymenobacter sp.]|nr:MAG: hypothetical protein EOO63_01260 [Hymenobacter sp.]
MDHFLKTLAYDCGLSQSQYWHLRLLGSISLVPLLGVLYLVLFDKRRRSSPAATRPALSLWVSSNGQLIALPPPQAPSVQEPRPQ